MRKTLQGQLITRDNGDSYYSLCLTSIDDEPIARYLREELREIIGKQVSLKYWISDKSKTKSQLKEDFIRNYYGDLEVEYFDHYSEYTGYLWTDEEFNVGGHDLINELRSYEGKYLYMIIETTN